MTQTVNGIDWSVVDIHSVTDGDTVRLLRHRTFSIDHTLQADMYDELLGNGVPIRLAWVDTPEKGEPGWAQAKVDTMAWAYRHENDDLKVTIFGDGGFGRLLGDVYYLDKAGKRNSLSQWLMQAKGWAPYVKGR